VELLPIGERILVKPVENTHTTEAGLYMPSSDTHFAEIVAVGEGKTLDDGSLLPIKVSKGQRVMLAGSRVGVEVMLNGVAHRVITERDILGLVR